jgi:hypothetical protein
MEKITFVEFAPRVQRWRRKPGKKSPKLPLKPFRRDINIFRWSLLNP